MCGRLNILDDEGVVALCEQLGLDLGGHFNPYQGRFIRATDTVTILLQTERGLHRVPATWWLLLEKHIQADGTVKFKPSQYTSFNTRYDKLNVPRSAGYNSFRYKRCLILVKGFGETQKVGSDMQYTDFIAQSDECIALGGVYRVWQPGNVVSFSVITTPAHPKLEPYHRKASPLMMPQDIGLLKTWLDPNEQNVAQFEPLLTPHLPQDLTVQPINKPSLYQPIAPSIQVSKD